MRWDIVGVTMPSRWVPLFRQQRATRDGMHPHHVDKAYTHGSDVPAENATFSHPWGIALDTRTNELYVADNGLPHMTGLYSNDRIVAVQSSSGAVRTAAGGVQGYANGNADSARFRSMAGIAVDQEHGIGTSGFRAPVHPGSICDGWQSGSGHYQIPCWDA